MAHGRMIDAGPRAMVQIAHAHVFHRRRRPLPQWRHRRGQPFARCKGRAREAGAVHRLRDQGEGLVGHRPHDDVVGLGNGDLELIHRDRPHILAVGLHHRHRQSRHTHVEIGHRRSIDDPQAHSFARLEQGRPIIARTMSVHEVGVGRAGHVGDIRRIHPHLGPVQPLLQRKPLARQQIGQRLLLEVEDTWLLLELLQNGMRRREAVVGQHDHMLAIEGNRIGSPRIDDKRAVVTQLLLQTRMAVVPVSPRLNQRELVGEGFTRLDPGKTDARNAVELERQEQAVPVDRGILVQGIGDGKAHVIALLQADQGARNCPIHGDRVPLAPVDRPAHMAHCQLDLWSG